MKTIIILYFQIIKIRVFEYLRKLTKKKRGWVGVWTFKQYDRSGKLIWSHVGNNSLADEGEENMLDTYLRGQNDPTTFFIRLYNDTPVDTDGLSDLSNEASGNGYAAQEVPRDTNGWPTLVLDGGDFQATSSQESFIASGGSFGPVTYAVLATTPNDTGLLIAYIALSQSRTVDNGDTLKITMEIKLA